MFVLQPKPTFEGEVNIPMPGGKEGKINFIFNHKGRKALKEFYGSLGEGDKVREDADALLDLVSGWKGVDVEFSAEALAELIDNYTGAAAAIFAAYNKYLFEGKQKN